MLRHRNWCYPFHKQSPASIWHYVACIIIFLDISGAVANYEDISSIEIGPQPANTPSEKVASSEFGCTDNAGIKPLGSPEITPQVRMELPNCSSTPFRTPRSHRHRRRENKFVKSPPQAFLVSNEDKILGNSYNVH